MTSAPEERVSQGSVPFALGGTPDLRPKVVIGIDPGATAGSITAMDIEMLGVKASGVLPVATSDLVEKMKTYKEHFNVVMVFLEQVRGYVPKDQPMSMHSISRLCRHAGVIEGIVTALGMPFQEYAPTSWHRKLNLPKGGNYKERKTAIYTMVRQRYPNEVSRSRCDSIAIALAGIYKLRGKPIQ